MEKKPITYADLALGKRVKIFFIILIAPIAWLFMY